METHIATGALEARPQKEEILVSPDRLLDGAGGVGRAGLALLGRRLRFGDFLGRFLRGHF